MQTHHQDYVGLSVGWVDCVFVRIELEFTLCSCSLPLTHPSIFMSRSFVLHSRCALCSCSLGISFFSSVSSCVVFFCFFLCAFPLHHRHQFCVCRFLFFFFFSFFLSFCLFACVMSSLSWLLAQYVDPRSSMQLKSRNFKSSLLCGNKYYGTYVTYSHTYLDKCFLYRIHLNKMNQKQWPTHTHNHNHSYSEHGIHNVSKRNMKEQKGIWLTRSSNNNNRNYHIRNGIVSCKRNGVHNRLKAKAAKYTHNKAKQS